MFRGECAVKLGAREMRGVGYMVLARALAAAVVAIAYVLVIAFVVAVTVTLLVIAQVVLITAFIMARVLVLVSAIALVLAAAAAAAAKYHQGPHGDPAATAHRRTLGSHRGSACPARVWRQGTTGD